MKLHISRDIDLPLDAVTQTFAVLAKRRVGKTYTASVMAEEFVAANLPFAVLDPTGAWWGLRSGKDGKADGGLPVYVIGGQHGIPLEPTAGKVIAEQVATHPAFYVIDVSQFESNAAQDRFATDFGERLYRVKEKHREPMHLFIDESDAFVPQRPMPGQQRMLGAFEALVRRGGIRGIGVTLISQRPAVVNKNVLTQTECIIVLQTTSPQDQDAIDEWVKRNGTDENRKTLMGSLASLQKGEAWIWSPAWLETFKKIQIRERHTFNSSATPKVGDHQVKSPALVPVDMDRLSEQIKATIEKAKESDPETWKRRVRELEAKLRTAQPQDEALLTKSYERGRREAEKEIQAAIEKLRIEVAKRDTIIKKALEVLGKDTMSVNPHPLEIKLSLRDRKESGFERLPVARPVRSGKLRRGAHNMLAALVQWSPSGMTEGQMRSHAGLKNSGTYSAYKTDLRSGGFIEERGGLLYATQTGVEYIGHDIQAPKTMQDVLDIWTPKLRLGARRMLEVLVAHKGEWISDGELREEAELANSGTYSAYKTDLKTARLAVVRPGEIAANKETLFL